MREIEFRGRRKDTGEWVYGSLAIHKEENIRIIKYNRPEDIYVSIPVDPETVGQYTGLQDFRDQKVYEGDIVEVTSDIPDEAYRGIIVFHDLEWAIDAGYDFEALYNQVVHCIKTLEVIGNIHDNSEILEEEKSV